MIGKGFELVQVVDTETSPAQRPAAAVFWSMCQSVLRINLGRAARGHVRRSACPWPHARPYAPGQHSGTPPDPPQNELKGVLYSLMDKSTYSVDMMDNPPG